ncbi:DUF6281 family protein [Nocardioides sp. MAHUQ-72]|uniref:DUF6281 family protein n=1 Tax=unclassified Nocardioides TaxID=2615069 RepID=UPI003609F1DF
MTQRRKRATALLVGSLAAAALTACSSDETSGGSASCVAALVHDGHTYTEHGDLRRDPPTTGRVVDAVVPACDDSGGQEAAGDDEPVEAAELAGVPTDTALLLDGGVYVRTGASLPAAASAWFRPPRCTRSGEFELTADWLGVTGPRRPRFDGDIRPPYRLEVHVTEGPQEYVGTRVTVRADAATDPALGPRDVESSLWQGGQVVARVRCDGGHFAAVTLHTPATG